MLRMVLRAGDALLLSAGRAMLWCALFVAMAWAEIDGPRRGDE